MRRKGSGAWSWRASGAMAALALGCMPGCEVSPKDLQIRDSGTIPQMHADGGAQSQGAADGSLPDGGERKGRITGRVFDQRTLAPLANVQVRTLSEAVAVTDARGVFNVELSAREDAALLFHAPGFARGIEPVSVVADETTFLEIQLLPVDGVAMIDSSMGGAVHGSAGAVVEFGANAFKHQDGTPVTGEVVVELTALDPSTPEGLRAFPGSFAATTFDGTPGQLVSVVPMDITARQGDDVLNIAQNSTATVHFPIPDPDSAPATIALWSLSEETGEWVEEGRAEKIFDATTKSYVYRGQIAHMSWWNCDYFAKITCIRGCVTTQDGKPVPQARTLAEGIDFANVGEGVTGPNGCFAEDVPAGGQLRFHVQTAAGVSETVIVQAGTTERRAAANPGACQDVGTFKVGPMEMLFGCPTGMSECNKACVDKKSSAANCGECGVSCKGGTSCIAGECVCKASEEVCDGTCTNVQTSSDHCGKCGNECSAGTACVEGACVKVGCPSGTVQCLAGCFNGTTCCGDGMCDAQAGESAKSCGVDCAPPSACGDGRCGAGETALNCAMDCSVCGDALCSGSETVASCGRDCFICGDKQCNGPETFEACPGDCPCTGFDCGNGQCMNNTDVCDGSQDCSNGKDESACGSCGDGICKGAETPVTCGLDCEGCGDGECSRQESSEETCKDDCTTCGDDYCSPRERESYNYHGECAEDCGSCGDSFCDWNENENDSCAVDCDVCGNVHCSDREWKSGECDVDCDYPIPGDECWDNEDCGAGLVCRGDVCAELGQEGEVCDDEYSEETDCAAGLTCIDQLCDAPRELTEPCFERSDCISSLTCRHQQCAAPAQVGESCEDSSEACAMGLACVYQYLEEGWTDTCEDPTVAGSPCNQDRHCSAGRTCVGDEKDDHNVGACRDPGDAGSYCEYARDCASGLGCIAETCKVRGESAAPCDLEPDYSVDYYFDGDRGDDSDCAVGFGCVAFRDGTIAGCAARGEVGATCGESVDCEDNLACIYGAAQKGTCVVRGDVGDVCDFGSHCADPLVCLHEGTGGTCSPPGDVGAACDDEDDCLNGLACKNHRCETPSSTGEACSALPRSWYRGGDYYYEYPIPEGDEEVDPRGDDRDCAEGNECWEETCIAVGELGSGCYEAVDCKDGLTCRGGRCLLPGELGERCDNYDAEDGALDCAHGLACDDGLCAKTPGGLFASCYYYDQECDPELTCRDGRCAGPAQLGEQCSDWWWYTDSSECAIGLECVDSACVTKGSLGTSCEDGADCADGLACSHGVCLEPAKEGEDCWYTPCTVGLVCRDWDEICVVPAQYGESCDDVACAPGLICNWDWDQPVCAFEALEGESCAEGSNTYCTKGLQCVNEECALSGSEGTMCSGRGDCLSGLVCSWNDACVVAPELGDSCADSPCGPGLACDTSNDTCTIPLEEGENCDWITCADGLECAQTPASVEYLCTPLKQEGEDCTYVSCGDGLDCVWSEVGQASYCISSYLTCNDGTSFPRGYWCDGMEDCKLGEDESDCAASPADI